MNEPDVTDANMNCLTTAWKSHQGELRAWLRQRLGNAAQADDLLQDLFLKALRQGEHFCSLQNPRAWLYEVARNTLIDHWRLSRDMLELPPDLTAPFDDAETVDSLSACLPRVLSELSAQDREAITRCDLQGLPQAEFARLEGLSLSAAKSRLQRARQRLHAKMSSVCQVQLDDLGRVSDFVLRPVL